ncbi:membrane protein containing Ion transport domain protein, partial [mine drainage metagenome]
MYSKVLYILNSLFTFLFLAEAIIKIIAMGFLFNNTKETGPYLKNAWNVLDFTVVVASLVDFYFSVMGHSNGKLKSLKALRALRVLRALRALRPLRMIARNDGLKLVVNALFASIPSMTNVLLVCS